MPSHDISWRVLRGETRSHRQLNAVNVRASEADPDFFFCLLILERDERSSCGGVFTSYRVERVPSVHVRLARDALSQLVVVRVRGGDDLPHLLFGFGHEDAREIDLPARSLLAAPL